MEFSLKINDKRYIADLDNPIDISIPISADGPRAWYVDPPKIEPVKADGFVGAVAQGGSVNFNNIFFNPHGHGTHTECVGHIDKTVYSINDHLKNFFFAAQLLTVEPKQDREDLVIEKDLLEGKIENGIKALVVRTKPNSAEKTHKTHSNTNPPYFSKEAMEYIVENKIDHLLVDQPSVDRESDGGALKGHHTFWQHPNNTRFHATITEMIFAPDSISDGLYFLNLMVSGFKNDAVPSKPILYKLRVE
ncbi:cyclase family protein [Salibacter sp.]|uniref:cyclase family protein n=1 Tax=Salibacter sp. TaxID=2010995 RepID=UPI00286FBBB4|nr:cyclase family protein [Salibacter sp.]MDR9487779.1 cyclase family protein [Salibacter sp.]